MRLKLALATIVAFAVIMGFSVLGPAFAQPGSNDDPLKMKICHFGSNGESHTIVVSENAWKAHDKHGDTQGPCSEDDLK